MLVLPLLHLQKEDFPEGVRTEEVLSKNSEYSKFLEISDFSFPFLLELPTLELRHLLAYIVGHEDGAALLAVVAHHDGAAFALHLASAGIDGTLKQGETLATYPFHRCLYDYLVGIVYRCYEVGIDICHHNGDALKDVLASHVQEIARLAHVVEREVDIVVHVPELINVRPSQLSRQLVVKEGFF